MVGLFNNAMLGLETREPGGNSRSRPPGYRDEKELEKADVSAVFRKKPGLSTQNPALLISIGL
jgi:hypothetical protein